MLIKNVSDSLVNGLQGVVVDLKPNAVTVKFKILPQKLKGKFSLFTVR